MEEETTNPAGEETQETPVVETPASGEQPAEETQVNPEVETPEVEAPAETPEETPEETPAVETPEVGEQPAAPSTPTQEPAKEESWAGNHKV